MLLLSQFPWPEPDPPLMRELKGLDPPWWAPPVEPPPPRLEKRESKPPMVWLELLLADEKPAGLLLEAKRPCKSASSLFTPRISFDHVVWCSDRVVEYSNKKSLRFSEYPDGSFHSYWFFLKILVEHPWNFRHFMKYHQFFWIFSISTIFQKNLGRFPKVGRFPGAVWFALRGLKLKQNLIEVSPEGVCQGRSIHCCPRRSRRPTRAVVAARVAANEVPQFHWQVSEVLPLHWKSYCADADAGVHSSRSCDSDCRGWKEKFCVTYATWSIFFPTDNAWSL